LHRLLRAGEVRIGSLNTGGLRRMADGTEDLPLFRNALTLRDRPPDMWFFQEDHSRNGSLAGALANEVGMARAIHKPASTSYLNPAYKMGNTISLGRRTELLDFAAYPYPAPKFPLYFQGNKVEPLGRFLEVAKVKVDGRVYTTANVHFPPMDALGYKD